MKYLISILLFSYSLWAYIPPIKMILDRTAENSGNGIYSVELEVTITDGSDEAQIKELWFVENDHTLRLQVNGLKELKGLKLNYLYMNDQKITLRSSKKESFQLSKDFIENWNHYRNSETLNTALEKLNFISDFKKMEKSSRAIYEAQNTGLSRSQGVINYILSDQKATTPQSKIWIEQDQFLIRKVKIPNSYELEFNNYKTFSKGLHFPKERLLSWGSYRATINTLNVSSKAGKSNTLFSSAVIDSQNQSEILFHHPLKAAVEEFYTRFR